MSTQYRATFNTEPSNVALARRSIANFAAMCGFSESEVADIRLAAGEALSNAVEHGRGRRLGGFTVNCRFETLRLTIEIRDSGKGFASPPDRQQIEPDERGRGFGIFLMRRLMDNVEFSGNGTVVRMVRAQGKHLAETTA